MKSQLSVVEKKTIYQRKLRNNHDLSQKLRTKNLNNCFITMHGIVKKNKSCDLACNIRKNSLNEYDLNSDKYYLCLSHYFKKSLKAFQDRK